MRSKDSGLPARRGHHGAPLLNWFNYPGHARAGTLPAMPDRLPPAAAARHARRARFAFTLLTLRLAFALACDRLVGFFRFLRRTDSR